MSNWSSWPVWPFPDEPDPREDPALSPVSAEPTRHLAHCASVARHEPCNNIQHDGAYLKTVKNADGSQDAVLCAGALSEDAWHIAPSGNEIVQMGPLISSGAMHYRPTPEGPRAVSSFLAPQLVLQALKSKRKGVMPHD